MWRVQDADFIQHQAFVPLLAQMPPRYLASLDVVQRAVLGFPAPGHEWWTAETVASGWASRASFRVTGSPKVPKPSTFAISA